MIVIVSFSGTSQDMELYRAQKYGALAKERLRIVDSCGRPVEGTKVWGGIKSGGRLDDFIPVDGLTDTNGEFVVQGKCTGRIRCSIIKKGYYASEFLMTNYGCREGEKVIDGKWQPYGEQHTLVLKKIVNPQPLLCHDARTSVKIPAFDEWIGFDFERYDFSSPYGKGLENDVLLRFTRRNSASGDYHMSMEVSFSNNPYAGAYELSRDKTSHLESVYCADTNTVFRQTFVYYYNRTSGRPPTYVKLSSDSYLVFRTRTKVDSNGKLISAHYGKIYGDWNFLGPEGMSIQQSVFNPIPNDTNLEDKATADYSRKRQRQWAELMQ